MQFWPLSRFRIGQPGARMPRRRATPPSVMRLEPRQLLAAWDVLSYHGDPGSTGLQPAETALTPQNVSINTFGKQFATLLDGQVYAQPLAKSGVNITVGTQPGLHDVVFVATESDSLYAIDAHSGNILWQTNFLDPAHGVTTVPANDVDSTDIPPHIGITSTPVINPALNVLYALAMTKVVENGDTSNPHYLQTLHAIDLSSGGRGSRRPHGRRRHVLQLHNRRLHL